MSQAAREFPDFVFQHRTIDLDGVKMHYIDEGPPGAPPIVMLHGNPTWSYYYRRLIAAFGGNHRIIVPDHIGMGLSEKPGEDRYEFTLARRVADLESLLESLKLAQPVTLVLHDWGGMIGMTYATRHPEKIDRFVVLNTGGFTLPKTKRMPWQLTLARTPLLGAILVRGFNAFCRGAIADCVMRPMDPATASAFIAPYDSWSHRLAVHRFIQDIPLKPGDKAFDTVNTVEARLGNLHDVPMLVCWGMKDFIFDEHFLNRWIELFPRAAVHRFDDAGHYVLEDAHERIIPLMHEFLNTTKAGTAHAGAGIT
jgi:haloalkane dehalogenase